MVTYARIVDGVAVDVTDADPALQFPEELAAQFVEVPEGTQHGSVRDGAEWRHPDQTSPIVATTSASRPTVGPNEFYFLWTIPEQVAIDSLRTTDKVVELFMRRLDDPRSTEVVLASSAVQAAVRHTVEALVKEGVIAEVDKDSRIDTILSGMEPQ